MVSGYHRICIERIPSKHAIAMSGFIGAKLPLHAGASGQLLLAYLPIEKRNEFFKKQSLVRFTKHTIIDRDELKIRLDEIREQGYAISKEEREPGAYSIVAPVWDTKDHIAASLSISGPLYRLSDDQLELNITEIISAADRISEKMANRLK